MSFNTTGCHSTAHAAGNQIVATGKAYEADNTCRLGNKVDPISLTTFLRN